MGLWENPGGGPLFSCFIAFLCYNFSKSFEGVHEKYNLKNCAFLMYSGSRLLCYSLKRDLGLGQFKYT